MVSACGGRMGGLIDVADMGDKRVLIIPSQLRFLPVT